tara:strand:+ start:351 stop:491 length:141 start_codon:yes stop_codon:yes gene_type:complete
LLQALGFVPGQVTFFLVTGLTIALGGFGFGFGFGGGGGGAPQEVVL